MKLNLTSTLEVELSTETMKNVKSVVDHFKWLLKVRPGLALHMLAQMNVAAEKLDRNAKN